MSTIIFYNKQNGEDYMSSFDTANKIKFAMGSSQTFTIANWEQTQFGMKYNTADGRFFDASKGLTDLLKEMNIGMNAQVTIEKRPNPATKPGQQDYGMFYVNNLCLADVRNGATPSMGTQGTSPNSTTTTWYRTCLTHSNRQLPLPPRIQSLGYLQ